MSIIPLPNSISFEDASASHAKLVISPLFPGYGTTMGNLLRRVLLSSLHGVAINGMKIQGVDHEFSTLPHMKEDMVQFLLNVKRVRIKAHAEITEPIELTLKASGKKDVTAGDIEIPSDVEIVNPDLVIATLTDAAASLDIVFTVSNGRGYQTVEQRDEQTADVGTIDVDTQYSPVVKVGMELENVRVGNMTNYDRLVLNIDTDGTRTPQEAVQEALDIIIEQVQFLKEGESEVPEAPEELVAQADDEVSEEGETESSDDE